jgi:putative phosphoesterase
MIVGIVSDTHDNLPRIDQAVKQLNEMNAELVLHAGDYVAPFVADHFKPLKSPLIGVLGNNDGEKKLLQQKFAEIGADIRGNFAFENIDGLRVGLLHGKETDLLRSLIELETYDVLVYGHTHQAKVYRKGNTLVINPGAVYGYLTGKSTIAVLDTESLEARIIQLNK